MLAIETIDLTKDYRFGFWRKRSKRALDSLNLQIEAGQVFGLLGPNGAGKTTTLTLLLRLIFPTRGTARILGTSFEDRAVRARLGYLPENPYLYDHLTPEELLNYVGELFDLPAGLRRSRVGELIEKVGLAESRQVPLRKFSKGMVQRAGIAQALMNDPDVVFLDEPMSSLDPLGRREVRDLILGLKARGKTVFFSTHILPDAETLCDQVAILSHGRLQGCGDLHKILRLEVSSTEVLLEDPAPAVMAELQPHATSIVRTGDWVRLEIPEEREVPKVLEIALRHKVRVVSLSPVKMSLEDFFLAKVSASRAANEAVVPPSSGSG